MTTTTATATQIRKCSQCGKDYDRKVGVGGSLARKDDEVFPFNGRFGVAKPGWYQGAFCSQGCYDAAYYEPPTCY